VIRALFTTTSSLPCDEIAYSNQQFETMLRRRPEVVECIRLSGAYDYLLKVVVESIEAYSVFIDKYVITLSAIRSVNSSFVLGVLKRTTALPLPGWGSPYPTLCAPKSEKA
jgi:DNA-binding Lrp family transcriptional regulator